MFPNDGVGSYGFVPEYDTGAIFNKLNKFKYRILNEFLKKLKNIEKIIKLLIKEISSGLMEIFTFLNFSIKYQ